MNVRFTPEAQAQADECDTWWRQNPTARDLFARGLAGIKEVLLSNPKLGTAYTVLDGQPRSEGADAKDAPSRLLRGRPRGGRDHDSAVWGAPRDGVPDL